MGLEKKKELPKTLKLEKLTAFAVNSSDDEWKSSIKGYYRQRSVAEVKAVGSGWYGSNGQVVPVDVYTDGKILYRVEIIGMFTDEAAGFHNNLVNSIKSKLTKAELELLGIQ